MAKRLLALLLACTVMLSVTACDDMSEEDVMGLMMVFAMMGMDTDVQPDYGELTDNEYVNETLGLSFVLPAEWSIIAGDEMTGAVFEKDEQDMTQLFTERFMQQLVIAYSPEVDEWGANALSVYGMDEGELPENGAFIMAYVINTEVIEMLTGEDMLEGMLDSLEDAEDASIVLLSDNSFLVYGWDMTELYENTPVFAAIWVGVADGRLIQILMFDTTGENSEQLLAFIESIKFSLVE